MAGLRDYDKYGNKNNPKQSPPKVIATHDDIVDIKENSIRRDLPPKVSATHNDIVDIKEDSIRRDPPPKVTTMHDNIVNIKEDSIRCDYDDYESESDPEQPPPKAIAIHDDVVNIKEDSILVLAPRDGRMSSLTLPSRPHNLSSEDASLRTYTSKAHQHLTASMHARYTIDVLQPLTRARVHSARHAVRRIASGSSSLLSKRRNFVNATH